MITNPSKAASMMFGFLGREQKPKPKPVPLPEPPIQMPVWNLKKQTTAAMTGIIFRASKKEKEVAPTKSHTWSWTQQRSRQLDGTPWKGIELDKNDKNL